MRKVLCVDDEKNIRRLYADLLPQYGDFDVRVAEDGAAALQEIALGFVADVVVTDLRMPKMDGCQLLAALRARGYTRPVLLVTAFALGVDVSGFAAVHLKPFNFERLAADIEKFAAFPSRAAAST